MKIEVIQYEPNHAIEIMDRNPREHDSYFCVNNEDWGKWIHRWADSGSAYTLLIEDEIIMSAGVILQGRNIGEAWMLLSSLFYKYKKECFKAVRNNLEFIIARHNLKRIQAFVMTNFVEAEHWLRHLGFENETPTQRGLRSFGPHGEDMFLYAME